MSTTMKFSLLAAAALLALQAQAAVVSDASATATQNSTSSSDAQNNQTEVANAWANATSAGTASANGFANQHFVYRTSASGHGAAGQSSSTVRLRTTITNTSNVAQMATGSFRIYAGNISTLIASGYEALSTGEYLRAGYSAQFSVGGMTRFSSSADLAIGADGFSPSLTRTGSALSSDDGSDGVYEWGTQDSGLLSFGILGAGESLEVEAVLTAYEMHKIGAYEGETGLECGYGNMAFGFGGCAGATYGDPFVGGPFVGDGDPGFTFTFSDVPNNNVPEPGVLALAGLGLLAAGWSRRTRKV